MEPDEHITRENKPSLKGARTPSVHLQELKTFSEIEPNLHLVPLLPTLLGSVLDRLESLHEGKLDMEDDIVSLAKDIVKLREVLRAWVECLENEEHWSLVSDKIDAPLQEAGGEFITTFSHVACSLAYLLQNLSVDNKKIGFYDSAIAVLPRDQLIDHRNQLLTDSIKDLRTILNNLRNKS